VSSGKAVVALWLIAGALCYKAKFGGGEGPIYPGTDVTDKVNQTLKRVSQ
jgi:hypothetical protein